MTPSHVLAVLVMSLIVMHGFVYAAPFKRLRHEIGEDVAVLAYGHPFHVARICHRPSRQRLRAVDLRAVRRFFPWPALATVIVLGLPCSIDGRRAADIARVRERQTEQGQKQIPSRRMGCRVDEHGARRRPDCVCGPIRQPAIQACRPARPSKGSMLPRQTTRCASRSEPCRQDSRLGPRPWRGEEADGSAEVAETTFDYVPGRSRTTGALIFSTDVTDADVDDPAGRATWIPKKTPQWQQKGSQRPRSAIRRNRRGLPVALLQASARASASCAVNTVPSTRAMVKDPPISATRALISRLPMPDLAAAGS